MRNKNSRATRHFCEGKKMTRKDSVVITTDDEGKKEGEQFASVRLAKFFMRTGRRQK